MALLEKYTREVILMDRTEEVDDQGKPIVQEVGRFNLTEAEMGDCAIIIWKDDYYVFSPEIWDIHSVVAFIKNKALRL